MLVLRLNATQDGLIPHRTEPGKGVQADQGLPESVSMARWLADDSPIIVLLHGYKWQPEDPAHCPHIGVFGDDGGQGRSRSWLKALREAGLPQARVLALGWPARGAFQGAYHRAAQTGAHLATFLDRHSRAPVHMLTHSLGARVALSTLEHARQARLDRLILMSPAMREAQLCRAMQSPRGRTARFITVTSGENQLFERMFDWIAPAEPQGALPGSGVTESAQLTEVRLDCPEVLARLNRLGYEIAAPQARICHWSSYLRPGVFSLYAALLDPHKPLSTSYLRRVLCRPVSPQERPVQGWDYARFLGLRATSGQGAVIR